MTVPAAALVTGLLLAAPLAAQTAPVGALEIQPIAIGESFKIRSATLGEERRINVYIPPSWDEEPGTPRPVLYMPDGGIGEDFLHIAGLLQVSVGNGSVLPMILVGIENTERRRDLTGPTVVAQDSTIAPRVGGSAAFRQFIREELIPLIESRYRTTSRRGIIGESLAGLFVIETLLLDPTLFTDYIAFDPSLWWNAESLVRRAPQLLTALDVARPTLYLANSGEPELARVASELAGVLGRHAPASLTWSHHLLPDETHATIYHPAALSAIRAVYPR